MDIFVLYVKLLMWISTFTASMYTQETIDTFISGHSQIDLTFRRLNYSITQSIRCAASCEAYDCCIFFYHNSEEQSCYLCTLGWYMLRHASMRVSSAFMSTNQNNTGYNRRDFNKSGECLPQTPVDCSVYNAAGYETTGEYTIKPINSDSVQVYCDMDTDGGRWTVFQRRIDGSENFFRSWAEYENGFGNLSGEFWLGNAVIANITSQGSYELRIDMEDAASQRYYAVYSSFSVDGANGYKLSLGRYTGDAGDSLKSLNYLNHNGQKWTTYDQDNDQYNTNCAVTYRGAWWYSACHYSNLNGEYGSTAFGQGINWYVITGRYQSLRFTEMKLRPAGGN